MRLVLILIVTLWGWAGLWAFAKTTHKSLDAKLTAAYLVAWPAAAIALLLNEPVPLWLSVPVVFGFVPWLMAAPHLWAVLKSPSASRPGELIGIPRAYWIWGGLGSLLLGLMFNGYA